MVWFEMEAASDPQHIDKRGHRMTGASPAAAEALTPTQHRRRGRHRKQRLRCLFSDSGFQDDFRSSPLSCPSNLTHLNLRTEPGQLSSWFMQYGDVGFKIQKEKETQYYPCNCLERQPQLTAEARCKLVSWLIPVHKHFHLSFECCCLTVNIVDRFLVSTPVAPDCFQLLGVTALLLASKQVEVGSPSVSHLLSLCCDAFSKEQLYNLERIILLRLNFCLAAPTLAFFLDYFICCIEAARLESHFCSTYRANKFGTFVQKVCELTLADYAFNKYPPSLTASCTLRVAGEFLEAEKDVVPKSVLWRTFTDEMLTQFASLQAFESADYADAVAANKHLLLVNMVSNFNHKLAEECKENLRALVSLNKRRLKSIL